MDDKEIADAASIAVGIIRATPKEREAIAKLVTQFLTDFNDLTCSLGCMAGIAIDHHEGCMVPDEDLVDAKPEGSC